MTTEPDGLPYRVLSLDGGGIKGAYSAAFLAGLEEMTGKKIAEHFDLIVGTSTGGILALALGLGVPAREIRRLYIEKGPEIFPVPTRAARPRSLLKRVFAPKHSPEPLRQALIEVFHDSLLGESRTRLVIPSYDGSSGDVHLFKTSHHHRFKRDHSVPAVDVAMATSAAPTYFPAFKGPDGMTLVDGGVWAACPAAVAVIEALTVLGQPIGSVDLLSVGTTDPPMHISEKRGLGGLWEWAWFGPDLFVQAQTKAALAHAKLLTRDRVLRVSESVNRDRFSLDDPKGVEALLALGTKEARHREQEVGARFLSTPVEPFTPFHGPRSGNE